MKKIIAIVLLCLCAMFTLSACQQEADMVETMVSTMFSTENRTDNGADNGVDGTITDQDGYIGNEGSESENNNATSYTNTENASGVGESIL